MAREVTRSHVVLKHQEIKLDDNSPSIFEFSIHANSTHHQIWCNQFESLTQIMGPSVQLNEEQFLFHDTTPYIAIYNMLAASLEIDSAARQTLVFKIMAGACKILHENLTVCNAHWVISVELYVVTTYGLIGQSIEQSRDILEEEETTYGLIDQPMEQLCDILEEEEIEMPPTTLVVTY